MHQRSSLGVEAYAISTLNDSFASGRFYDSVLLRLIDEARKQPSSKNFYIIHLMGTLLTTKIATHHHLLISISTL
ncbi:hypothetical protein [Helicobacter canis]|nr:hypothetical protein [Helicobacter canis]